MKPAQDWTDSWKAPIAEIDKFISGWVAAYTNEVPERARQIVEAVNYSLTSGGKRFRPLLSYFTAEALGETPFKTLPFSVAVEFVHTYSLVHDDLPSMDNDEFRRGKPTSHKVFGEAIAILAGDDLLTEAFNLITDCDVSSEFKVLAVKRLALAAGGRGMVGGQVIDIKTPESSDQSLETILLLHRMKTGALIKSSVLGTADLLNANSDQKQKLEEFSDALGVAFQIADDIEDAREGETGNFNYVHLLGEKGAYDKLSDLTRSATRALKGFPNPENLLGLAHFNVARLDT